MEQGAAANPRLKGVVIGFKDKCNRLHSPMDVLS